MKIWFREYNFVYWLAKYIVKSVFYLFSRVIVKDEKKVPREGPVLLVANHISWLDPPLIAIVTIRKLAFLAKKELFKGFVGWYMTAAGHVQVDRGKGSDAVATGVGLLNSNRCVCIFPEGTRSRTGKLTEPKTGVVVIASHAGKVPIVPVCVEGTFAMMPPGSGPKPWKTVKVTFGDPFYLSDEQNDLSNKAKMKETANWLMEKVVSLSDNPDSLR